MPHFNFNEVAIIDIVTLFNVRSSADATKWLTDNKKFHVIMNPYPTATLFAYNISVLSDLEQLAWLKEASDFIDYKNNYKFIEILHNIQSSEFMNLIDTEISNGRSITYSLSEILSKLGLFGYQAHNYEKYISLEPDFAAKDIAFRLIENDNQMTNYCFSFPFFRNMIYNKSINDLTKCDLVFVEIDLPAGKTLMFKLEYKLSSSTIVSYYDYSHNPPLRSGAAFLAVTDVIEGLFKSHKINF